MANNLKANPVFIDTAFTTPTFANSAEWPTNSELLLHEIYWYNPVNIGDTFVMTLGDGTTIVRQGRCEVANQSQVFRMWGARLRDFAVPTLASGTIFIYYR